jgi:hypothetical protein
MVGKYGTVGQAADGNIIRRMRIACWITKSIDKHLEYIIRVILPRPPPPKKIGTRTRLDVAFIYKLPLFLGVMNN